MRGQLNFTARMFAFSDELKPYFTSLYVMDFDVGDGPRVEDLLAPEWTSVILTASGQPSNGGRVPAPRQECTPFTVGGPSTRAVNIDVTNSRIYGFGITPAGWARHIKGDASDFANLIVDGHAHREFVLLADLMDIIADVGDDSEETAYAVNNHLLSMPVVSQRNADRVLCIQQAIADREITDVGELCEACGTERRAMERLTKRYFGFTPKLLLRRQRFLRTLASFMLSPAQSWGAVVDGQYVDQAHFVRDFREFMGVTPTAYAQMDHPIISKIAGQRLVDVGAAPEAMVKALAQIG